MFSSNAFQIALFGACIAFLAIDADLLLRQWLDHVQRQKGKVRRLGGRNIVATYRQLAVYAVLVISMTWLYGPMSGLAISMILAALSIGIETWQTIRSLLLWLVQRTTGRLQPGSWVPYRKSAGLVEKVTPFGVTLRLLNGEKRSFPITALAVNVSESWKTLAANLKEVHLVVDRHADLLAARAAITRAAAQFAPGRQTGLSNVAFRDLSRKRTVVDVRLIASEGDENAIQHGLQHALKQIGCQVYPSRAASGMRLVTSGDGRAA